MKKCFAFILVIIIICFTLFGASAEGNKVRVYADKLNAVKGESQLIYIRVSDNTGLMGFKIHFAYLSDSIRITKVARGDVTKSGMFMNNLGLKDGGFDIIWNNTSQINEDGVIAVLYATVLSDEPFEIYLSYSEQDTFDESYKNVDLLCGSVKSASFVESTDIDTDNNETTTEADKDFVPEYSDDIGNIIVSEVIDDAGIESLDDISNEQKDSILESVNSKVKDDFGVENAFGSFNQIEESYKHSLLENLDSDIAYLVHGKSASDIIEECMEGTDTEQINNKTAEIIIEKLEEMGLSEKYKNNLNSKELNDALNNLISNSIDAEAETEKPKADTGKLVMPAVVAFALVLALAIILLITKKRKGGKGDE